MLFSHMMHPDDTKESQSKTKEYKFFYRLRNHYENGNGTTFWLMEDEMQYLAKKGTIDYIGATQNICSTN